MPDTDIRLLICSKCKLPKPTTDFWPNKRNTNRKFGSRCKPCLRPDANKRMRRARARNPEKFRESARRTQKKARKKINAWFRAYNQRPERKKQRIVRHNRLLHRTNDALRMVAFSHRRQWSADEISTVLRGDLTARAAADRLGRTLYAVFHQRRKLQRQLGLPAPIYEPTKRK